MRINYILQIYYLGTLWHPVTNEVLRCCILTACLSDQCCQTLLPLPSPLPKKKKKVGGGGGGKGVFLKLGGVFLARFFCCRVFVQIFSVFGILVRIGPQFHLLVIECKLIWVVLQKNWREKKALCHSRYGMIKTLPFKGYKCVAKALIFATLLQ